MRKNNGGLGIFGAIGVFIAFATLLIFLPIMLSCVMGVEGFGPYNERDIVVTKTYIDTSSEGSHYMVATDVGVFEVNNGWLLKTWNADAIFGQLVPGGKYRITTKGNQVTNWFMQEYPYIVKVIRLHDEVEKGNQ